MKDFQAALCNMISTRLLLLLFVTTLLSHTTRAFVTPLHSSSKTQHLFQAHSEKEWDLNIAIVGAGPSGLLLAHKLLKSTNLPVANIDVFESRSDPRDAQKQLGSRAYALGLGIRGRSAIRSVDEDLWKAVKKRGFECERFRLHLSQKLNFKLRDREEGVEPSCLIYQTDLCSGLLDELELRSESSSASCTVHYETVINHVDLANAVMKTNQQTKGPYDLIVGCDGANSIVRDALGKSSPPNTFQFTQRKLLPGCFKVARCPNMPPLLDPNSVALVLPESKALGVTAFVEPTVDGGCCILFAGKLRDASKSEEDGQAEVNLNSLLFPDDNDSDVELTKEMIFEQFPLLDGTPGMEDAVQQLLNQRTSTADSVKCNIYHSPSTITPTALCGDAAHATGGVSGQGCNSALIDAAVLVDCLDETYRPPKNEATKKALLHQSLQSYSNKQVPEGTALYDLSFGNDGKTLPIFRNIKSILSNVIDTIFGGKFGVGKKPLQTLLASSLDSFTDIRRDRQKYFVDEFPTNEEFVKQLESVYD